jgi:Uma2 family endonuclease
MSALPDFKADFFGLERFVESQPEGVRGEIAGGVFLMSPRPSVRHSHTQAQLLRFLDAAVGSGSGSESPEWLFLVEPELRSARAFSRLIPDLAGWRRSTTGWPGPDETLISRMPEWVLEVVSPGSADTDRGPKRDAYGVMGVGWLWIVDPYEKTVETFVNVRGTLVPEASGGPGGTFLAAPFELVPIDLERLFLA